MKIFQIISLILLLSTSALAKDLQSTSWQTLIQGIDYKTLERSYSTTKEGQNNRHSKLHAFRIQQGVFDLSAHSFHALDEQQRMTVDTFRQQKKALMVLSGGFFQSNFREPVGLMIEKGQTLFPLAKSLSGVVWIKKGTLHLSTTKEYKKHQRVPDYALQGYPRIVDPINRQGIQTQREKYRHRVALCQIDGYFIILISDKNFAGLSLYELSKIAQAKEADNGLACDIAINLDGGPAPALSIDKQLINLSIKESTGWQVPNVIVIKQK
jgi:uncharacterized protein YigE (DUF2233 family)